MPDNDRFILWSLFTEIVSAFDINPEEYIDDFNKKYEAVSNESYNIKKRAIKELANSIVKQRKIVKASNERKKEEIERAGIKTIRFPSLSLEAQPDIAAVIPTSLGFISLIKPEVVVRKCRYCGREFIGLSDDTISSLMQITPIPVDYYYACDECVRTHFGYPPPDILFADVSSAPGAISPAAAKYLRLVVRTLKRAKRKDMRERKEGK